MNEITAFDLGVFISREVKKNTDIGGSGLSYGSDYGETRFIKEVDRDVVINDFSEKYPDWTFEKIGKTGLFYERKNKKNYWAAQKEQSKRLYEKEGW